MKNLEFQIDEWPRQSIHYDSSMFHISINGMSNLVILRPLEQYSEHFEKNGYKRELVAEKNNLNWVSQ